MLRLHIEPYGTPSARKIEKAVQILHRGGVAAYPTDTVFGLGCALEARRAVERIYRAKQMRDTQRLSLMVPTLSAASEFAHFSREAFRLAQRIFPGPYTLILPASRAVPKLLVDKKRRTVGIRIPDNPVVQALLDGLGRPLLTTSAIRPDSGEPCIDGEDAIDAFGAHLDVVIDCEPTERLPSTVLDASEEPIVIVREGKGAVDWLELR